MDATAILFPLIIFISGISALLSVGGGNLFAMYLGEKNDNLARKSYKLSIALGILIGGFYSFLF